MQNVGTEGGSSILMGTLKRYTAEMEVYLNKLPNLTPPPLHKHTLPQTH